MIIWLSDRFYFRDSVTSKAKWWLSYDDKIELYNIHQNKKHNLFILPGWNLAAFKDLNLAVSSDGKTIESMSEKKPKKTGGPYLVLTLQFLS